MDRATPPSLLVHLWERDSRRAIHGTAGSTVLARARTYAFPLRGRPAGVFLNDPAPHTWTWDWGFEEDVPVPAPQIRTVEGPDGPILHARYHDGTVLVGCATDDGRAWAPFALELSDRDWRNQMDAVAQDACTAWAYTQGLPPISTSPRQGPFDSSATFMPHVEVGGPMPAFETELVRATLALGMAWLDAAHPDLGLDPPAVAAYVARSPRVGGRWYPDAIAFEGLANDGTSARHGQAADALLALVHSVLADHRIPIPHWAGPLRAATGAKAVARAGAGDKLGTAHFRLQLEAAQWPQRLAKAIG
jgi:hypothetical protein